MFLFVGRGKGGKGLGKGGAKRHRKILRDNIRKSPYIPFYPLIIEFVEECSRTLIFVASNKY